MYILGSTFVVLLVLLFLVAFKVTGSSEVESSIDGCTPYNVVIERGENEFQAVIKWLTKDTCTSFISYGTDRNNLNLIAVGDDVNTKKHTVAIDKLLTYKTYYFLINSESQDYGIGGMALSFTLNSL